MCIRDREEPTTTLDSFEKYTDDDGRFSIEFPDDWSIYTGGTEFPMQQSKRYAYLPDRSIGFYDSPLWKTTVQVFEHERDIIVNADSGILDIILDISATDSEVLEYMVADYSTECYMETFEDSARNCVWSKTVDSYIFYTNDNKKAYIVKEAYTIQWWNLQSQPRPVNSIYGVIYGENNIWEIMAETTSISGSSPNEHDDAIMHMIKSFSLEPKSEQPASEPVTAIPEWIKNNAGWWAEGQIDDSSFLQGIQFLIKEGIMVIPPTEASGTSGSEGVPAWVKNNAGWWAEGQIDDSSFLQGIQCLVKEGIIKVS